MLKHISYSAWSHIQAIGRTRFRKIAPGRITVAGLLSATTGLGSAARLCHSALTDLGFRPNSIDLCRRLKDHTGVDFREESPTPLEGGTAILIINPPELPTCLNFCHTHISKKKLVGLWNWELCNVPKHWRFGAWFVDEVWAPSNFVKDALESITSRSVRVVPYPVVTPTLLEMRRKQFSLPEDAFIVFGMCDLRSSAARKNPLGTIQAFKRAFSPKDDAILILKVSNSATAPCILSSLYDEAKGYANIRFLLHPMPSNELATLIFLSDVLVSLHRSEGFGLPMAEAMALSKPVVATGWSGNMDFMTRANSFLVEYKLVPISDPQGIYRNNGAVWAEPNLEQASHYLRQIFFDAALRKCVGRRAAEDIEASLGNLDLFRSAGGL